MLYLFQKYLTNNFMSLLFYDNLYNISYYTIYMFYMLYNLSF